MIKQLNQTYNKLTRKSIINNSYLRSFPLLQDSNGNKFFNVFRSFKMMDLDVTYFIIHESSGEERWDTLSQLYYQTPYLWWTIPLVNGIENNFELPESGENLKILKKDYIYNLITEMVNKW